MTGTLVFLLLIPIVINYGLVSSRNHLVRVNFSFLVAYFFSIIFFLVFKYTSLSQVFLNLENWYNSFDNFFNQNIVTSFPVLKFFLFLLLFLIIDIFWRILLHFIMLGKNPAYLNKKDKIFHLVNIMIYFVFAFLLESYIITYFCIDLHLEFGFFEKWFSLIYRVTL